jgi:hypothetical protein
LDRLACQFLAVVGGMEPPRAGIPVPAIGEAALEEADFLVVAVAVAAGGLAEVVRSAVAVQAEAGK